MSSAAEILSRCLGSLGMAGQSISYGQWALKLEHCLITRLRPNNEENCKKSRPENGLLFSAIGSRSGYL